MRFRMLLAGLPLVLTGGCAGTLSGEPAPAPAPSVSASTWMIYEGAPKATAAGLAPGEGAPPELVANGTFMPYTPASKAITYDTSVVPAGSRVRVAITMTSYGMVVRLTAGGMIPRRAYGAHLHTQPCTGRPDQAGPHYQHAHDPKVPSVNPSYANAMNEVWLDFTADQNGAATSVSEEDWTFGPKSLPRSLVIHEQLTRTGKGVAGTAGARVACLTLPASS